MSFITGEKIQQLCDIYCGSEYDLNRNPVISSQKDKHLNIDRLNTLWDNPSLIFCYSCALTTFMNKLHLIQNPFILVSHNEDNNITSEYLKILDNSLVIRWFAQNVMIEHPKLNILPIGFANSMWPHGNVDNFINIKNVSLQKEDKIYFYFNISTSIPIRQRCKLLIESKGLKFGKSESHMDYLINLSKAKFAICPPGNGIDCHRMWECYYFNVIPILLRSPFTEKLSKILPCVLLNDWTDFDQTNIFSRYDELIKLLDRNRKYTDFNYYKTLINTAKKSILSNNDKIQKYNYYKSFSLTDSKNMQLDFKLDNIINKKDGFFIELGANDGLDQSNTAFFEFNRGWKGILIEPSYNAYSKCIKNRPNSICYNYACVSNEFKDEYISGDFNGKLMSSVNGNRLNNNELIKVKTSTLENILDKNNVSSIDLLSLDTEGYELNILKGLNLNKYRPKYIIIEIYIYDFKNILEFLEVHNYSFVINFSNYNKSDNPHWDQSHNDYLFVDSLNY